MREGGGGRERDEGKRRREEDVREERGGVREVREDGGRRRVVKGGERGMRDEGSGRREVEERRRKWPCLRPPHQLLALDPYKEMKVRMRTTSAKLKCDRKVRRPAVLALEF